MRSAIGFILMVMGVAIGVWTAPGIVWWLGATTHLLPPSAVGSSHSLGDALLLAALVWLALSVFRAGKHLAHIP